MKQNKDKRQLTNDDVKILPLDQVFKDFKKVETQPHNLDKILGKAPFRSIINGPSGSGKSLLFLSILTRFLNNYFKEIYFFSPSVFFEEENKLIKKKNPRATVKFFDTPDKFNEIVKSIQDKNDALKKEKKQMKKCLIIIDDFISHKKFMKSKGLMDCFIKMRKYSCSLIFLTQYYRSLLPAYRLNCTCLIVFIATLNEMELSKLIEENSVGNYGKKWFQNVVNHCSSIAYSFLCINKNAHPDKRFFLNLDTQLTI